MTHLGEIKAALLRLSTRLNAALVAEGLTPLTALISPPLAESRQNRRPLGTVTLAGSRQREVLAIGGPCHEELPVEFRLGLDVDEDQALAYEAVIAGSLRTSDVILLRAALSPAPQVRVLDAHGNLVTTATNTVLLNLVDEARNRATEDAVAGVASFGALYLRQHGTYAIQATSGALTPVTAAAFTSRAYADAAALGYHVAPAGAEPGRTLPAVVVEVRDAAGERVCESSAVVTIAKASGTGTLSGTLTATAVCGLATFDNLTISQAGAFTLRATSPGLTSVTSPSFTVGTLASAAVVSQPARFVLGAAFGRPVRVELRNADGDRIDSTRTVTVSLESSSEPATMGGTLAKPAVAGVATFDDLTIALTGVPTGGAVTARLRVSVSGLVAPILSAYMVNVADPAPDLEFTTAPTNSTADNAPGIVVVKAYDVAGHVDTAFDGEVTLAIAGGTGPDGATLGGTSTVNAVAGVATFDDLTLGTAGSYRLLAVPADGEAAYVGAECATFTMTPGLPAALAFADSSFEATSWVTLSALCGWQLGDGTLERDPERENREAHVVTVPVRAEITWPL